MNEVCSSDDVSRVLVKWKGSDDTEHLHNYTTSTGVLDYFGHGKVELEVDDTYRWKAVDVAVSFETLVGSSPWSEWHSVSSVTNSKLIFEIFDLWLYRCLLSSLGDIKENEDFQFEVTDVSYHSITVRWTLSARARSMIQAKFIRNFNYTINGVSINGSLEESYTFSNLSAGTTYYIVGIVITSDNMTDPIKNYELRRNSTKTWNG